MNSDNSKLKEKIVNDIKRNREHMFQAEDFKPHSLIKTRDKSMVAVDGNKYVDLCWFNNTKKEWEGVLDINKVPNSEKIRLGGLYKNTGVILFCEIDDVDDIIKLAKKEKVENEKFQKEIKDKFKNI